MKLTKRVAGAALAATSIGFMSTAFANHFTVNGSENGSFSIHGMLTFGAYKNASFSPTTFFPDNQSDTDNPVDNGTPVTLGVVTSGSLTQYSCTVGMAGSVVGGVASITSMTATGSQFCNQLVLSNFPWRLHTLSQGNYSAVVEGIGFYHTSVFSCMGVSVGVGIQPGLLGFGGPLKQGGCFLETSMALTVTPSLDIVSN
ncbi:hypothetical protein DyAD56_04280 [Dyella sp. AD56]|uniref:hypothetical protein n=1 Tax=Dyella sp. AD56 TaxID=1528744 RepID=UPI000C837B43|nr:hypothetical protein [Dyella sp. AD56]PMQ06689.1 hypothetical protein DyAD56_04280 [Dyella sp. AD56]